MSFISSLDAALSGRGIQASNFCNTSDATELRILMEYGAVFLADRSVSIPSHFMFNSEAEVTAFQSSLRTTRRNVGGTSIELQAAAITALDSAIADASAVRLTIAPRGGATGARRSYANTLSFWNNKIRDGIAHWTSTNNASGARLTAAEASTLRSLSGIDQIRNVLALETRGFFFSTDKRKTILASVAAPGTSQHLFMLALDVEQFGNSRVRSIMAQHGWFQTVFKDHPHFTFLGLRESVLSSLGLESKTDNSQLFWVPKP